MRIVAICVLTFAAALLPGQLHSFEAYTYQPPQGYTSRDSKDFRELSRIDKQWRFTGLLILGPYPQATGKTPGLQLTAQDGGWTSYKPLR